MDCLLSAGRWPLTHPWLVPAAPFRSTLPSLPRMGGIDSGDHLLTLPP